MDAHPLTSRSSRPPARIVGSSRSWAVDQALLLAALPPAVLTPMTLWSASRLGWPAALRLFVVDLGPGVLLWSLCAGVGGAVVGWGSPRLLEALRGKVPLPLLAILYASLYANVVFGTGALLLLAAGTPLLQTSMLPFFALVSGVSLGLAWLPYTMARVVGAGRGPVLVGTGLLTVVVSAVSWLVLLVL
jgi:hypothetical protein